MLNQQEINENKKEDQESITVIGGIHQGLPTLDEIIPDNEEFILPESMCNSKEHDGVGVLTIINAVKGGKRVEISKEVAVQLTLQDYVEVKLGKGSILLGKNLEGRGFALKKQGTKSIIYSSGLVQEITTKYSLDFSKSVSKTFKQVEYAQQNGCLVALIKMI